MIIMIIIIIIQVNSAFYPSWDGKINIGKTAVMLFGWEGIIIIIIIIIITIIIIIIIIIIINTPVFSLPQT